MKARYNFRFDPVLVEKLDKLAKEKQRSRTNMIEVLITEATKEAGN